MHAVTGIGRVIAGRYELVSAIGHGAMGTVWRATDPVLTREVAIKEVTLPGVVTEQDRKVLHERTLREARAAAKLNHPGVVTVYDVIDADGSPWIVMELVAARSLDQVLAQDGPLSPARAAEMGVMLLGALACAHEAGIVHRDVKPGNVLLTSDGRAVLTDFGIATLNGEPGLTQAGMIMGTPGFCAPERIRGEPASPASDLWSLGATLYTAVEGHDPYHGQGSPIAVLSNIVHSEAPLAPSAGPLGPVITALLRRDPTQRPDAAAAERMLATAALSGPQAGSASSATPTHLPSDPLPPVTVTPPPPDPLPATAREVGWSWPPHEVASASQDGPASFPHANTPEQASAHPRPGTAGDAAAAPPPVTLTFPVSSTAAPRPQTSPPGRRGRTAGHARPAAPQGHRQPASRSGQRARVRVLLALGGAAIIAAGLVAGVVIAHARKPAVAHRSSALRPTAPRQPAPPSGYHWYRGPAGSAGRIAVPDGWQTRQRGGATSLHDPATGASILIIPLSPGGSGSLREARAMTRSMPGPVPGRVLHRLALRPFVFRGGPAGLWRLSYRRGASETDVLGIVARLGSRTYGFAVTSPAADWQSSRTAFGTLLRTFTPPPA